MRVINPYFSAVRRADKQIGDSIRATKARTKRVKDANDFLNSKHRYKLVENGMSLGDMMEMTGREAKAQNQVMLEIYQEDLREEIDAGVVFGATKSQLKRWVLVERFI